MATKTDLQLLPKAEFNGVQFPYSSLSVQGSLRKHVHEFWKISGGMPEKGGRKPYSIKLKIMGQNTIKGYGSLFPGVLNKLRSLFEGGQSGDLVVPHMGILRAYASEWSDAIDPSHQSGVDMDVTFEEDGREIVAFGAVTTSLSDAVYDLQQISAQLKAEIARLKAAEDAFSPFLFTPLPMSDPARVGSLLDAVTTAAAFIQAAKDTGELYRSSFMGRVRSTIDTLGEIETMLYGMTPESNFAREALRNLQAALADIEREVTVALLPVAQYVVLRTMSIGEVSTAIYGSLEHSFELLQMNTIESPLSIQPGTVIKHLVYGNQ